jgi:hypothetical protein
MNDKQAKILIAGLIIGLLIGLFPPRVRRDAPVVQASRAFLFSSDLYLHQTYDPVTHMGTSSTHFALDMNRLLIEWMVSALATATVFVACRNWNTPINLKGILSGIDKKTNFPGTQNQNP